MRITKELTEYRTFQGAAQKEDGENWKVVILGHPEFSGECRKEEEVQKRFEQLVDLCIMSQEPEVKREGNQ